MFPTRCQLYPEIADMYQNPAFSLPYGSNAGCKRELSVSVWSHFWNLLDARRQCNGYHCRICGVRFSKRHRKNKQAHLCTYHLKSMNSTAANALRRCKQ